MKSSLQFDTEGQLCKDGSQGGEIQEEMINTRDLQVLGVSDALWKLCWVCCYLDRPVSGFWRIPCSE